MYFYPWECATAIFYLYDLINTLIRGDTTLDWGCNECEGHAEQVGSALEYAIVRSAFDLSGHF